MEDYSVIHQVEIRPLGRFQANKRLAITPIGRFAAREDAEKTANFVPGMLGVCASHAARRRADELSSRLRIPWSEVCPS